jgi:cob(I)alamin adenosyltransferase
MSDDNKVAVCREHDLLLSHALNQAQEGACDMLILDEVISAYHCNAINQERLNQFLDHKPESLELVLTGRNAPQTFLDRADYVTEMQNKKHPFDQGIPAREGIEY